MNELFARQLTTTCIFHCGTERLLNRPVVEPRDILKQLRRMHYGRLRQFSSKPPPLAEHLLLKGVTPMSQTANVALWVRLEAKAGKEAIVADFLRSALPLVEQEPATLAWYAIRLGPSIFGIFDAFPDEVGRNAHLSGKVAEALMAKASELLARAPQIEKVDVLAAKLPKASAEKAA